MPYFDNFMGVDLGKGLVNIAR